MTQAESREFRPGNRWFENPDVVFPLLLTILGILFFSDPLFSSKNFYFRDILNFHYPLRKVLISSYARGELPLWNPFVYLGQPMLANPNYMTFYPTNLLHLLMPFNYAFKLHFILHPVIGGLGVYFLQRRLGVTAFASLFGALAYQFSGAVLSFLNLYNIVPAVALMPWIGWAFLGAVEEKCLRRTLLFGVLVGLQIIAFEPLIFQCNILLLAGLALLKLLDSDDRGSVAKRLLRTVLSGCLFACCLAAVQLLPSLELLTRCARGGGLDFSISSRWSMHPMDFLNTFVPNLFGNYYSIGYATSWGEAFHHGSESVLVSFFLGWCTLVPAALSFMNGRKSMRAVWIAVTLISIGLALGRFNPLYQWLCEHVGVFRVGRFPSKYFLLSSLMLSLLAGLGFEALLGQDDGRFPRRRKLVSAGVCGVIAAVILFGIWGFVRSQPQETALWLRGTMDPEQLSAKDFPVIVSQLYQSLLASGTFLLLCSSLILAAPIWKRPLLVGGLMMLLLGAELIPANLRLSPLISGADVDFVPPIDQFLQRHGSEGPYRVAPPTWLEPTLNRLHAPNRSLAWISLFYRISSQTLSGIPRGIQYSLDGTVDLLNTRESEELYRRCVLLPEARRIQVLENVNSTMLLALGEIVDSRTTRLASFDTMSDLRLNLYQLRNALPRAYFASGVDCASSHQEALEKLLLADSSLRNNVILETPGTFRRLAQAGMGEAKILEYSSRHVVCEVQAKSDGHLVLLDSYYPGWHARVDGVQAGILQANYAFRAVAVPAGIHRVEFVYRPRAFYLGLTITLVALVFGALLAIRDMRRESLTRFPAGAYNGS